MQGIHEQPLPKTDRARVRGAVGLILAGSVGVAAAFAVPSATLAAGALTVTRFAPASGPVGTVVTITGTGLASGDLVSFNGTSTAATTASRKGTKLTASLPAFATSGPITVIDVATQQSAGPTKTAFKVTTGLFATPNHIWPGTSFTVEGSGLTPNVSEPIDVGKVNIGKAETNGAGDFSMVEAMPPSTPPGTTSVSATDPGLGDVPYPIYIVSSWPTFRHDAAHSGLDPYEPALTPTTVRHLGSLWSYTTAGRLDSPAVVYGMVYAGSEDGYVYALNAVTGRLAWRYLTSPPIESSPAVSGGVVYVDTYDDGTIYALNAATGSLEWSRVLGGFDTPSPVVVDGLVYVGTGSGMLYALKAATGTVEWSFDTMTSGIASSPAVAGGVVYFGSDDGCVYALNATTGTREWRTCTGGVVQSSPTVVAGVVYIGSYDDDVYALNASTGAVEWTYTTGGGVYGSPAVAGGVVYIGSIDGKVYALDALTGAREWSFIADDRVFASPAVANGVVYIGGDPDLYALKASTGALLWSTPDAGGYFESPAVAGGVLYDGADDFKVYAFGL
jgi:outer membrane protein assembly factor BamB